ncbi:MAG: EAL domain-containing protein [Succinivibrionaceae bacterium]
MGKLRKVFTEYKTSGYIIVFVVLILVAISLVYKERVRSFMINEMARNIVSQSLDDMSYINSNFKNVVNILQVVSNSLSDKQYIGGISTHNVLSSISKVTGFVNIGIVDFNGKNIYGTNLNKKEFLQISRVFYGTPLLTVVQTRSKANDYSLFVAVPVFDGNFVKYSLYLKISNNELTRFLMKGKSDLKKDKNTLTFLVYNLDNIVEINSSTRGRLLPSEVIKYISKKYKGKYDESLYSIEQSPNEIHILETEKYPSQYMSIIPMDYPGWMFVTLIPTSLVDTQINAIMTLLTYLVLGTIIILMILLVTYEWSDHLQKQHIHKLAYVHEKTGLPNRSRLREFFASYKELKEENNMFVIRIVISNYNLINRLYGSNISKRFILQLSEKLKSLGKSVDLVASLSDGFVVLMQRENSDLVTEFLHNLSIECESINESNFKAVIVCAVCETDFLDMQERNMNIDYYLESCKLTIDYSKYDKQKHNVIFYSQSIRDEINRCDTLEKELDSALEKGEFVIYLQPKYNLHTNKLSGAEALIRWNYHMQGIIPPFKFIPVFEKNGSIAKIDNFVFVSVLKLLKKWKNLGYRMIPISVNFSQVQFLNPKLIQEISEKLKGFEDVISYLEVEITESATIDDKQKIVEILHSLKKMGFKLSMDDFGTGYSSLSNISALPFDTIKLDKSFVDKIDVTNVESIHVNLVRDVILMSKHMNMHCLVEGVETYDQKNILRDLGCEFCQGYYYSKPIPVDDFDKLLKDDKIFNDNVK